MQYEVIVGNVGTVYAGANWKVAGETFREYVKISRDSEYGRAAGESVVFMKDGEIIEEYTGTVEVE